MEREREGEMSRESQSPQNGREELSLQHAIASYGACVTMSLA